MTVSFALAWVLTRAKRAAAPRDCGCGVGPTINDAVLGFQHFTVRFNLARTSAARSGRNVQHCNLCRSLCFVREERAERAGSPREIAGCSGATGLWRRGLWHQRRRPQGSAPHKGVRYKKHNFVFFCNERAVFFCHERAVFFVTNAPFFL